VVGGAPAVPPRAAGGLTVPAGRTRLGRDELSRTLAQLRDDAGLSGAEAAHRAGEGFSQSKVSRWESGRLVPSPDDVDRYARALGAADSVRRRLVARAHDLHDQHRASAPARITLRRTAAYQRRVGRIEAGSAHVATFHPLLVPGLLQTADYARAVFSSGELTTSAVDAAVAARLQRQQLLGDNSRRFTLITTAGALGWRAGPPTVMAAQIDQIMEVSRRSNVRVGIIPWGTEATVFPPGGFDLYDERLVIVGMTGGAAHITDPRDVAGYVHLLTELEQLAAFDDPARELLAELADKYRALRAGATLISAR
jgi:transcriptional regulator with XRE-family HTH domain